jgi:alpha-galactosidase
MDPLEFVAVLFHFGGEFFNDGKKLHYLGGDERISFIEHDKMSLPEVIRHLKDHYNATDPVLLHWLFPGKELLNVLRVLVDDKACVDMSEYVTDGGVADIFVKLIEVNADDMEVEEEEDGEEQCSDWEKDADDMELEDEDEEEDGEDQCSQLEKDAHDVDLRNMSSLEQVKDLVRATKYLNWIRENETANKVVKAKKSVMQEVSAHKEAPLQMEPSSNMDAPSDKDYLPSDDESSEEDEEAVQIRADLKELKKKLKATGMVMVDEEGHEVNVENLMASNPCATNLNDDCDSNGMDTD